MPNDSNDNDSAKPSTDELIQRIGSLIVNDVRYRDTDWQSLALVGDFSHGQTSMKGYVYFADKPFSAQVPKASFDMFEALIALRDIMATSDQNDNGAPWHQCLIHITKPSMKIAIQFEYDDPDRWSPGGKSLDMSAYADSLRPPSTD